MPCVEGHVSEQQLIEELQQSSHWAHGSITLTATAHTGRLGPRYSLVEAREGCQTRQTTIEVVQSACGDQLRRAEEDVLWRWAPRDFGMFTNVQDVVLTQTWLVIESAPDTGNSVYDAFMDKPCSLSASMELECRLRTLQLTMLAVQYCNSQHVMLGAVSERSCAVEMDQGFPVHVQITEMARWQGSRQLTDLLALGFPTKRVLIQDVQDCMWQSVCPGLLKASAQGKTAVAEDDVWSVGMLAFKLLCGTDPFPRCKSVWEWIQLAEAGKPTFPDHVPEDHPIRDFVEKCFAQSCLSELRLHALFDGLPWPGPSPTAFPEPLTHPSLHHMTYTLKDARRAASERVVQDDQGPAHALNLHAPTIQPQAQGSRVYTSAASSSALSYCSTGRGCESPSSPTHSPRAPSATPNGHSSSGAATASASILRDASCDARAVHVVSHEMRCQGSTARNPTTGHTASPPLTQHEALLAADHAPAELPPEQSSVESLVATSNYAYDSLGDWTVSHSSNAQRPADATDSESDSLLPAPSVSGSGSAEVEVSGNIHSGGLTGLTSATSSHCSTAIPAVFQPSLSDETASTRASPLHESLARTPGAPRTATASRAPHRRPAGDYRGSSASDSDDSSSSGVLQPIVSAPRRPGQAPTGTLQMWRACNVVPAAAAQAQAQRQGQRSPLRAVQSAMRSETSSNFQDGREQAHTHMHDEAFTASSMSTSTAGSSLWPFSRSGGDSASSGRSAPPGVHTPTAPADALLSSAEDPRGSHRGSSLGAGGTEGQQAPQRQRPADLEMQASSPEHHSPPEHRTPSLSRSPAVRSDSNAPSSIVWSDVDLAHSKVLPDPTVSGPHRSAPSTPSRSPVESAALLSHSATPSLSVEPSGSRNVATKAARHIAPVAPASDCHGNKEPHVAAKKTLFKDREKEVEVVEVPEGGGNRFVRTCKLLATTRPEDDNYPDTRPAADFIGPRGEWETAYDDAKGKVRPL